jgi:hypothetical protein
VSTGPVAEACPNCGAPLELDAAGACRWCQARIRAPRAASPAASILDPVSLVPEDADDCWTSAPFLALAISTLTMLSTQPAVAQYLDGEPRLVQQVRGLSTAVSAAGVRVRDAGLLKDSFDGNLAVYTPGEIATFDLAFDVIAMIGALDGLSGQTRAMVASNLQSLDWYAQHHAWKKGLKKAGDAGHSQLPAALHELRAQVPHRG